MQPDPTTLMKRIDLERPLIGLYDAPDPSKFEPLVECDPSQNTCAFAFFSQWLKGKTLHLTKDNYGCGGAGRQLFGIETREREKFISFLADEEGLKSSRELMARWINTSSTYQRRHPHILIGPVKADQWEYARTITFYVNPDQLSALMIGAQYHSGPDDPPPVIAPFSSGCGLLAPFRNMDIPQAAIGATDIAMRQYLPRDILAFTVTRPMFKQLCELDERSFLYKPFLQRLRKSRGLPEL